MKYQSVLNRLLPLIGLLALVAVGAGLLWPTTGQSYPFTTLRGETVTIAGRGLYRYDTLSAAAQEQAQDLVTLVMGLPLLVVPARLAMRGSLRGQLLLAGTLGYFLYTYTSMAVGSAYNPLFLVYVALFSLSLWAFILSMLSFDVGALPQHVSPRFPRRSIASVLFAAGGFLLLAWLGRIVPSIGGNQPPVGLESNTTLFIQVLDLGLIVPLASVAGVLLLRRRPLSYLLASVVVMKFLSLGIAVSTMGINMLLVGVAVSSVELIVFLSLTLVNLIMAGLLLKHIDGTGRNALPA